MGLRTTRSTIGFAAPFRLKGRPETFEAGSYEVETEEEAIDAGQHIVYLRVATLLYVRSPGMTRTLTVDPGDLQSALARDKANSLSG